MLRPAGFAIAGSALILVSAILLDGMPVSLHLGLIAALFVGTLWGLRTFGLTTPDRAALKRG